MEEPIETEVDSYVVKQQTTGEMTAKEKIAKEQSILDLLNTIRVGKSKILSALAVLKKKDDEGEKIDRTLVAKLVESYDGLKLQEDEFICMLKKLSGIQDDIPRSAIDLKIQSLEAESDEDFDYEEAHKTLSEAEKMAKKASDAVSINNQLQKQIFLNQQKKSALAHLHNTKTQQKSQEANKALQEVEFSKLKLASESETLNRKQRQLERLRREAAKRGYIGKAAGEKKVDKKQVEKLLVKPVAVADEQANSERVPPIREVIAKEEDLLVKQTSNTAEGNKNLKKDEFHARISERFAAFEVRKQRMRQLRSRLNQFEEQKMEDTYGQAIDRLQNLTSMRKQLESMQIAENSSCSEGMKGVVDEVEAEVSSSSSQEKSKLIELHSKLSSQELDSVDGSVTTDELINQVRHSFNAMFPPHLISAPPSTSNSETAPSIERVLRPNTESELESRLRSIESILHNHTDQLNWIGDQVGSLSELWEQWQAHHPQNSLYYHQPKHSTNSAVTVVTVPLTSPASLSPNSNLPAPQVQDLALLLKSCLLNAHPTAVHDLIRILTAQNGTQKREQELDEVLHRLVSFQENILGGASASPSLQEPIIEKFFMSTGSNVLDSSADNTELLITVDNSTTPNEQSFESIGKQKTAALRLDTEGAELEKRRTLENVRLYANTTNPMENSQKVENSIVYRNVDAETEETLSYSTNGIEKEIFIMVEFIVPWIDKRRHELVRQDALDGFRDAILLKTKEIFSANEHIHSSNFEKQLGAIIDDCLAKYVGVSLALHKEGLILDLAENLYNEFAFIKLMASVDSIGRK